MCLILSVQAPASRHATLAAALRALPPGALCVKLAPEPHRGAVRWPWARPRVAEARVSERGGCACSLLSDEADWNAEHWALRADVVEPLARTLGALAEAGPDGLAVEALWVGERPAREERVTPAALRALVRVGQLGTRTRYVVHRPPAG